MQNVKGTYDFFGKEQALRKRIQNVLEEVFELYDFNGMESTVLNELELLTSKYAGGDEILKEMYQLTDQGSRRLGLRYDLTIPFAKVLALNPGISLPFKRYEIGKVYRDGPVKKGRLREFLQCDVDIAGIAGAEAEAELLQAAVEVFKRLDIPIIVEWNNREFMGDILESLGVPPKEKISVMLTLDKVKKVGCDGVMKELDSKGIHPSVTAKLAKFMNAENMPINDLVQAYGLENRKGTLEVCALQELIDSLGMERISKFNPFLSRGLSFYTGTVYEILDATGSFTSSLGGGGRYDSIIGKLITREDIPYPVVGLSFGMESIMEIMKSSKINSLSLPQPKVVVIPIGEEAISEALKLTATLRGNGIRTRIDLSKRKLKKSLSAASANEIPFVILIGNDEARGGKVRLKDMKNITEHSVTLEEATQLILR
ncbi:histidine--tRNA ligase [Bacillus horti]|uniref:Histidine--tRNA ligase n=1 Tax=Caldalkalibacillus horti TaxID=77523 RepID=A0ABT9W184_9BACI|nr:histidine--tRNA ligase [Bacillus horti]MDQ0166994.1 histidyl-tRNA synthetase [Bacillus horti]